MRLVNPHVLLLLLLMPLLFLLRRRRQRPAAIPYPIVQDLAMLPPSVMIRLYRALPWLRALVLILGILALARPQWGVEATKVYRQGIAIDMIVDISRSMAALDFQLDGSQSNRLEVVKQAFRRFVQGGKTLPGRDGDLIGMVAFARYADSISPLTLDHTLLLELLDTIDIVTLPEENGTAIGEAIALGVDRLRNCPASSRVMILFTDGSNNAGGVEPLQAAQIAKAFRIKIYTIGTGTGGTASVAAPASNGHMVLRSVPVSIDERPLKEIATITGGRYFRATDSAALQAVYAEIDRLETTPHVLGHYQQYVEGFPPLLLSSLALLLLEAILVNTRFRTLP